LLDRRGQRPLLRVEAAPIDQRIDEGRFVGRACDLQAAVGRRYPFY